MIRNIDDLEKVLSSRIIQAMKLTEDKIFKVISEKIIEYYNEPVFDNELDPTEPVYYQRTGQLLEELTASHIEKNGNDYSFTVGYPDSYLSFKYRGGYVRGHRNNSYNKATGLQVLKWMNDHSHGGLVSGEHDYWDDALSELGGEEGIIELFKQNCIKVGIPIIK